MHVSAVRVRELLRNAFRHAFGSCGAARIAIRALHAATTMRCLTHGVRRLRNAARRISGMRCHGVRSR
eukprot:2077686-Lingulodinium_polyedra.AAC.1